MRIKLTWHPGSHRWSKVIGKRVADDRKRLVQAQHYFTAVREESESLALAMKAEWVALKRTWVASHRPYLETVDEPFLGIPHWYDGSEKTVSSDKENEAFSAESNHVTPSETADAHREATLKEVKARYFTDRKVGEGIDFKGHSNRNHEVNLDNAMRFIDPLQVAADLTDEHVNSMRLKMLNPNSGLSRRTARNYGMAFKAMLVWYWKSELFYGRPTPNFDSVFAKFPKIKAAKPKHLPFAVLKTIFGMADAKRRLYLLLMLNTGMTAADIAHVQAAGFDLRAKKVTWKRQKNDRLDRPSDVEVISHLWPETIEAVRSFKATSGLAFRNKDNGPLEHITKGRNRLNSVAKVLNTLFRKVRKKGHAVTAKNYRQTGAQLIKDESDTALSRVWLGRSFEMVDQAYLIETYAKLDSAAEKVHQKLLAAGVLKK